MQFQYSFNINSNEIMYRTKNKASLFKILRGSCEIFSKILNIFLILLSIFQGDSRTRFQLQYRQFLWYHKNIWPHEYAAEFKLVYCIWFVEDILFCFTLLTMSGIFKTVSLNNKHCNTKLTLLALKTEKKDWLCLLGYMCYMALHLIT